MIETERLIIRPFQKGDEDFLFVLNNHERVNRYRSSKSSSLQECHESIRTWTKAYGQGLLNVYLVMDRVTEFPIGLVALFKWEETAMAELGYRFLPDYWGKGYCKEASGELIGRYFSVTDEDLICAETHPDNQASISFLVRNGFYEADDQPEGRGKIYWTHRKHWLNQENL